MPRPQFDNEKTAAATISLEQCVGWKDWLVPIHEWRLEEIKEQLLKEGLEAGETERLRVEYRIIRDLLDHPGKVLAGLRKHGDRPAGPVNGAV